MKKIVIITLTLLGLMGSIFQSVINGAPNLVFDSMKPFMLKEAYSKLRTEVDSKVKDLMGDYELPNSISPLDMSIGEARRKGIGTFHLYIREKIT